ncbi:hypothetical protein M3Y94_00820100 [Aphelenchoides besseyi]|nr:hypothetical protein M3Y94_00820100 [Aphelenchoides besseyi]
MAANLSLRYSVIISNRSMRVRTYFNLNIENYNASAHSEHKLVAMGYEHGKTCYSNITRRHSSEHGKDDYEREKMDFNKLFNVKLLNQVEDIYRRVVLSSCRINLHRSAESNSTRDSDPVAILLSLTVAFGNRCGIPIYGFDRSGRDAATPHFINADSYEFWAESSFTNHYAKANNMVGIYFEMQKFADARPHGPVTIIPPFFFCCFSCPWMNAEYIDGNLCFFGTLKFSMDKEHANVVFQIRGLLSKLLQKSGIDFNGKTKLVNDIYKLATLVEAYRPSSIVPIPIEPLPPVNSAQH